MIRQIISDASPLIAFSRINHVPILLKLFGVVFIPEAVAKECLVDLSRPGATVIQQFITKGKIKIKPDPSIVEFNDLLDILGTGEASAIKLALATKSPLLIDEKLGRHTAKKLQLKIIGTAGVLLLAKQRKIITKLRPIVDQLKQNHYHLSDELVQEILKQAHEA